MTRISGKNVSKVACGHMSRLLFTVRKGRKLKRRGCFGSIKQSQLKAVYERLDRFQDILQEADDLLIVMEGETMPNKPKEKAKNLRSVRDWRDERKHSENPEQARSISAHHWSFVEENLQVCAGYKETALMAGCHHYQCKKCEVMACDYCGWEA
jgi:hypothetical protein